jgi:hypothetical protein
VNGLTATLIVNNKTAFSMAYAPRVINGWSYGLNYGLVGFGSNNSKGLFDNVTVQVLPPQITYTSTEDFADGVADQLTGGSTGTWAVASGRITGTAASGATAYDLMVLPGVANLSISSYLELSTVVNTASRAGIVFDWYSATDYKWVALDVNGTLSIGHTTARSGRVTDKSVSAAVLAGVDYTLGLSLKGSTVSVSVNSQQLLGYVFNSVTVDGRFGLMATGATRFDNLTVKTNDEAFLTTASALLSEASQTVTTSQLPGLTQAALDPVAAAAKARWIESGLLDAAQLAKLERADVSVGRLAGSSLGLTSGDDVLVDAFAGGYGWYIDPTPFSDDARAFTGVDLLTVVVHELGHVVGFEHADGLAVMEPALPSGIRRLPFRTLRATTTSPSPMVLFPAFVVRSGERTMLRPAAAAVLKPAKRPALRHVPARHRLRA